MEGEACSPAEALRRAFDASFADAPLHAEADFEAVLRIRVAGRPYVARLSQLSGLYKERPIRRLPTERRELLGVVVIRSSILPVFDLRMLLAIEGADMPPAWLLVRDAEPRVCFAFHSFDGYARVDRALLVDDARKSPAVPGGCVPTIDGQPVPVLDIESMAARIEQRLGSQEG